MLPPKSRHAQIVANLVEEYLVLLIRFFWVQRKFSTSPDRARPYKGSRRLAGSRLPWPWGGVGESGEEGGVESQPTIFGPTLGRTGPKDG